MAGMLPTRMSCLPAAGGLPRMKAFIDSERSADPDLVLLNAGDDFVGTTWDRKFGLDSPAGFMNSLAPDVMVGHQGACCAAGCCMSALGREQVPMHWDARAL